MPLTALTLSFECNQTSRESMSVVGSSDAPIIYQANETAIRASLFDGDPSSTTFVPDISNVLSARLVIRKNHARGTVLLDKEATLDGTTTYSNWSVGTKQHFLFELSEVETNQAVPSDGTLDIYAVIEIVTGSGPIVIGFFNGEIQYDGITGVGDPVPPTLGAETANTVYAGPSSGLANLPDFRALVSADIPVLAETKITNLVSDLAARQPLDATLTALAGVTTAVDKLVYSTASDAFATTTFTSFARTLLDDTDAVTMRGTINLGATSPVVFGSLTAALTDKGGQVFNAAAYSGADLGVKIQAAHNAMPSNGGIIETGAVSLVGNQTLSAITLTKPVTIRFGFQDIIATGSITIAAGAGSVALEGVGLGENKGTTITTPNGVSLIVFDTPGTSYQNTLTIKGCCFKPGTGATNIIKSLSPINSGLLQSHFVFEDNQVRDFAVSYPIDIGTTFYVNFIHRNWFHDNLYSIRADENSDTTISDNSGPGSFGQINVFPSNTRIVNNTFVPAGQTTPDILINTRTSGGDNGILISGNSFTPEGEIAGRAKIQFHSSFDTTHVIKDVRITANKFLSGANVWGQTAIQIDNPVNNLSIRGNHFDGFQYVVGDEQSARTAGGVFDGNTIVSQQVAGVVGAFSTPFKNGGRGFDVISFTGPTLIEGVFNEPRNNESFYLINRLSDSDNFSGWVSDVGTTVTTGQTDPFGGSTASLITRNGATTGQNVSATVSTGAIGSAPIMGTRVVITFWAKAGTAMSVDVGLKDTTTGLFPSGLRRLGLTTQWKKYKLTVSGMNASDAYAVYVYPVQYDTATAGTLYLWHFQVADLDSDFLPTTGAAASDLLHGNRYERGVLLANDFGFSTSRFFDLTNAVALRNGTTPQSLYISNTYTNDTNYERAAIQWSGNVLTIGTQKAGTGSNRNLTLNGDNGITFTAAGQSWSLNSSGVLFPNTDAARDLGISGTNRPRDLFLSRNAVIGGAVTLGTPLAVASGGNGLATATLGGIRYASAANTLLELAGNTTSTKKFLAQTGTGTVSAAPAWAQPAFSDVTGRITSAQLPLGAQLYDNAGTSKLAADLNARLFYGPDGTGAGLDLSTLNQATLMGTHSFFDDGSYENGLGLSFNNTGGMRIDETLTFGDGGRITLGTVTGSKIGTATTQKLAFFNATPVVQQTGNAVTGLSSLGLITSATWPAASLTGTTTNDNATAGSIGEYVSASVVVGGATALTTATPKTVTSISLTAGDWDVTAIGAITGASTGTEFDVAISANTNSFTGTVLGDTRCQTPTVSLAGADASLMVPVMRVSISSTTTYYLVVQETFTVGTPAAYGRISARRVR